MPLARGALDLGDRVAVERRRLAQPRVPAVRQSRDDLSSSRRCRRGSCTAAAPSRSGGTRPGRRRRARRAPSSARSCATMLVAHLLLDAVGAEPGDRAADVEPRLVQRVAERLAGVAAHDEAAPLGHERAHVADRSADDDVGALQRDRRSAPRRRRGSRAGRRGRSRPPTGCALPSTIDAARTSCSRRRRRRSCRARGPSRAGSCRRSSSRRGPRSRPRARRRARPRCCACRPGCSTRHALGAASSCRRWLSSRTVVGRRSIEHRLAGDVGRGHQRGTRDVGCPSCRPARARAPTSTASSAPGSTAIARYSDAIATHSSVSAITAGLHAIGSRSTAKPSAVPTANV